MSYKNAASREQECSEDDLLSHWSSTPTVEQCEFDRDRLRLYILDSIPQRSARRQMPCSCDYSSLSTTFGSSRDARHAGSQLATTATAVIVAITKAIVTITVGFTPNSRDAISRFTAKIGRAHV